jgi:hypothetical protein
VAVAYGDVVESVVSIQSANLIGQIVDRYLSNGVSGAVDYYRSSAAVETELTAMIEGLKTEEIETVSDMLALFDAYSQIGVAEGLILVADGEINKLLNNLDTLTEDDILAGLTTAAFEYSLASNYVQLARDSVDVGLGFGTTPVPDEQKVLEMAETLRRAAESNLALFDSLIIDDYARQTGLHPDVVKNMMMSAETNYLFANASRLGIQSLSAQVGDGPQSAALIFGHSQNAVKCSTSPTSAHAS